MVSEGSANLVGRRTLLSKMTKKNSMSSLNLLVDDVECEDAESIPGLRRARGAVLEERALCHLNRGVCHQYKGTLSLIQRNVVTNKKVLYIKAFLSNVRKDTVHCHKIKISNFLVPYISTLKPTQRSFVIFPKALCHATQRPLVANIS
jgi:hypothetical protein